MKWIKLGRVFDPTIYNDRAWLKEFAQAPSVLLFDDYVRVYFSCRSHADYNGQYVSYTAYLDLNRFDLTEVINISEQPILPLGKIGEFDEFGIYPTSVIEFEGKHRAYYAGWTRCESVPFNVAIGVAESSDGGKTFTKIGSGPVLGYSPNEPFIISGPKIRIFKNKFFLYYISGRKWKVVNGKPEPVYKIRLATSDDGFIWRREDRDLIESRLEVDEAQASPDVLFHNNKYHMFFCYRWSENFRSKQHGYRIGYAYSDDGIYWTRDDERVGIDVSDEGWDSEMISYPHVFELDGNIYMAYLGNHVGKFGFGLAKLDGALG